MAQIVGDAVSLDAVSMVYAGGIRAVDRVALEVAPGELLVLVGPSGCGKSTLLRLIAGLSQPTSGEIRIGGRRVNELPARRRDVAMVFQHPALYPHWTVYQNIVFGLRTREEGGFWRQLVGRKTQAADIANGQGRSTDERVREVAGWLGLERLLERRPGELSGGERQRVALGRALTRRAGLTLLDEPLVNLDPALRLEARRLLAGWHRRRPTTILVTHDQAEALSLGQRVAVMHAGRLEQVGTPRELYERPANAFVARLIGTPPMSLLAAQWVAAADGLRLVGEGWNAAVAADAALAEVARPLAADGREVWLGLRVEAVRLAAGNEQEPDKCWWGVVRQVELAGGDELVEVELGATTAEAGVQPSSAGSVWIRVSAAAGLTLGQRVPVVVDFRRAQWFDRTTGERIGLASA